jgi:hypothetical protein
MAAMTAFGPMEVQPRAMHAILIPLRERAVFARDDNPETIMRCKYSRSPGLGTSAASDVVDLGVMSKVVRYDVTKRYADPGNPRNTR